MDIKSLLLFLIPWSLFFILFEFILRKKLNINRPKGFYRGVNNLHKRVEIGLFIGFLLSMIIMEFFFSGMDKYTLFIFFTFLFGVRAFMEWKFDRPTREYIITFWAFCFFCVFTISFIFLF
ncbi:DUF4181 domain-containing protein [Neobacillus sp. NPDC058068]|uniref:DUF4181 domain-containing protein n=1 Tax=Neobacillus sp. NPDC058068 TaxID=3346325 RepID=UPI0036DE843C